MEVKLSRMISKRTIITRNNSIPTVELDGEIAMMNVDKGYYYGLNSVGSRIWELIKEPISYSALIAQLLSEYNVDRLICEGEANEFLEMLLDEGLIVLDNSPC